MGTSLFDAQLPSPVGYLHDSINSQVVHLLPTFGADGAGVDELGLISSLIVIETQAGPPPTGYLFRAYQDGDHVQYDADSPSNAVLTQDHESLPDLDIYGVPEREPPQKIFTLMTSGSLPIHYFGVGCVKAPARPIWSAVTQNWNSMDTSSYVVHATK